MSFDFNQEAFSYTDNPNLWDTEKDKKDKEKHLCLLKEGTPHVWYGRYYDNNGTETHYTEDVKTVKESRESNTYFANIYSDSPISVLSVSEDKFINIYPQVSALPLKGTISRGYFTDEYLRSYRLKGVPSGMPLTHIIITKYRGRNDWVYGRLEVEDLVVAK
jgi:hypothetical protein